MNIVKKIIAREAYHPILSYPLYLVRVFACGRYYRTVLASLSRSDCRVRVFFLSAGCSKWKCQSVYDEMAATDRFEPMVVCSEEDRLFYERLGCRVVDENAVESEQVKIVVYQDPWSELAGRYSVWKISRRALCCYVPYSIESIAQGGRSERFDYHHLANFHGLMFACFQWSEDYARHYIRALHPWEWAGQTLGFGHPSLDAYYGKRAEGEYVIYAPHFAFEYNGIVPISSIGTFPWSGEAILEYVKAHPEQKWLFKPHPKLRDRLVEIGFWTRERVGAYYHAWESVATACYDGDYAKWFLASRAMITDSNSFLLEYMAVGKPLIHLVPGKTNMVPCQQAKEVFETFYVAKNGLEMTSALRLVVEEGRDPLRDERLLAAKHAAVLDNHAGKRIVQWLTSQIDGGAHAEVR